jgi:hypothetical protein
MTSVAISTSRRIGQFIKLLGSDQPGEVSAAVQALNRTLLSAGLDFHELADAVETQLSSSKPAPRSLSTFKRPDDRPLRMGERLVCDQPDGVFRPCRCGSIHFTVAPSLGPHFAQLVCNACRRRGRWLARWYFGERA